MKRMFVSFLFALALPMLASAQTHPCDQTVTPNPQATAPVAVGFCAISKDTNGQPVTLTSFKVSIDSTVVFTGALNAIGLPNAQGKSYYETPKTIVLPKGAHNVTVVASTADGDSIPSTPFAFGIVGLPSVPVTSTRIVGS